MTHDDLRRELSEARQTIELLQSIVEGVGHGNPTTIVISGRRAGFHTCRSIVESVGYGKPTYECSVERPNVPTFQRLGRPREPSPGWTRNRPS